MEHYELVQEMGAVERMATQERLKHARKRRSQQMKKWAQYERQLEKENTKKKKNQSQQKAKVKKSNKGHVRFAPNIALLEAAARNDLVEVRRLLESGVSPDVTNEDGLTALHQCCIDDSADMMKLLLEHNANVNACDSEMWTPLHAAATCGHVTLCGHLIDRGAELLAVNADGNMPYDICEDEVTLDYIETEMAKRGITQEQIDLTRLATEHQMLADLKEHVAQGGELEYTNHNGATLLHIAAANGYVEVAEFLLDNHVSVDKRDNDSWQPVHAAAYWAQQEILEMLVESGADLDAKTKQGETPFDLCEDPDLKQKILDMKDEIETKRSIMRDRNIQGSQRKHRPSSRNASIRRSSMRGDKTQLFKKEHKEEALHFGLNLMQDEEMLVEAEEEHENVPATDLDEVTIVVAGDDDKQQPSPQPPPPDTNTTDALPPNNTSVTTITVNKPTPKPRLTVASEQSAPAPPTGPQISSEPQRPAANTQAAGDGPKKPGSHVPSRQPTLPAAAQNPALIRESNHTPPPPGGNVAANQGRRPSAGSTLLDLKKQRSNSRENLADLAMQNMFLETVQSGRRGNSSSSLQGGGGGMDKTKNGHNNNNTTVQGHSYSTSDGHLRRFVAPTNSPVVGEEEDKERCCVIL